MRERPFAIIPVIDLKGGVAVRARAGERHTYAPLVTSLSPSPDPAAVACGLLRAVPARTLYVCDLDAIDGGDAILSLDFRGEDFVGPPSLLDDPSLWPCAVIAMTLARVGTSTGPDLLR